MPTFEELCALPQPPVLVELYALKDHTGAVYYNSGRDPVLYNYHNYEPAPIKRGVIKYVEGLNTTSVTVTVPINRMLTDYLISTDARAEISIYRMFTDYPESVVPLFHGVISGGVQVDIDAKTVSAKCESVNAHIMDNLVPQMVYSSVCQNALYDNRCGLKMADERTNATLTAVDGVTLTAGELTRAAERHVDLNDVAVMKGDHASFAVEHDLAVIQAFKPGKPGTVVEVYPGCNGSKDACKSGNYNGCPSIPGHNPVLWGV